jgi:ribosomal RNA-processing protein 17
LHRYAWEKAKKERRDERKERREEMRRTLGIVDAPEGPEEREVVAGAVEAEVVEYGSGVTVIVEGID